MHTFVSVVIVWYMKWKNLFIFPCTFFRFAFYLFSISAFRTLPSTASSVSRNHSFILRHDSSPLEIRWARERERGTEKNSVQTRKMKNICHLHILSITMQTSSFFSSSLLSVFPPPKPNCVVFLPDAVLLSFIRTAISHRRIFFSSHFFSWFTFCFASANAWYKFKRQIFRLNFKTNNIWYLFCCRLTRKSDTSFRRDLNESRLSFSLSFILVS